jgi:hypothetical protein
MSYQIKSNSVSFDKPTIIIIYDFYQSMPLIKFSVPNWEKYEKVNGKKENTPIDEEGGWWWSQTSLGSSEKEGCESWFLVNVRR